MRIAQFEVRNQRSVAFAMCDKVPQLLVVTGPNGSGKSTLLYALREINGRQNILYIGPHRSTRRQQVQQKHLLSGQIDYESMLCRDDAPGIDGIKLMEGRRDPWSADDSANYLKHSLCQIEIDRQEAIAFRYERDGEIVKGSLLDPWEPLKTLTKTLLPHLQFSRIDKTNRDQIRCLWTVHSKDTEVDLDDLSSGEKAVIQMFYPLLEHRIRGILSEIKSTKSEVERPDICVLIDEPELHLHPNLQVKVYDYLRELTASGRTQAVLVTHSPTIVEHATFDELFLLRPIELANLGENQLVQIATDEERLLLMREVFGTTSNVTAMQPIVIVEGVAQKSTSSTISDRKLYRAMCQEFDAVTVIPGGGKSECISLLRVLASFMSSLSDRLKVVALLDLDTSSPVNEQNAFLLPVSMIENFMLDPLPLWESIQSVAEKTGFTSIEEIEAALDAILGDYELEEIARRTKAELGTYFFRPGTPIDKITQQARVASNEILEKYSIDTVNKISELQRQRVLDLSKAQIRREHFHGKEVLNEFYRRHLHSSGMSKEVFKYETARHSKDRKKVKAFFEQFFDKILEREKKLSEHVESETVHE